MAHEKNPTTTNQRQLKIYQKYQRRENTRSVFLPEIRLCGKWLQDLGFACGGDVTVKSFKNKLEITFNQVVAVEPVPITNSRGLRKKVVKPSEDSDIVQINPN